MSDLQRINALYSALSQAEASVQNAQQQLEQAQDVYNRLREDLGDLFHASGLSAITMADGKSLTLETLYFGSISQERMESIRDYLARQGSEGMIKPKKINITGIDIKYLPPELQNQVEFDIHSSTLKSFIKELALNNKLDSEARELFKVHQENRIVIK